MKILIIYLLILSQIKKIKGRSEEFYECINLEKTVTDSSNCINIKIPDSDGYKCCSMKITYNKDSSYSCFALENKYTTNQEVLNEYITKRNISSLFNLYGGEMEINCGNNLKIEENYKKLSDEYLNCYNNHIKGTANENDCILNDIPEEEGSKCCFVETSTKNKIGNIINDKRCYMVQDKYFTNNKNLSNFLLDESKSNSLDEINNINITINCKNYETFYLSSLNETNEMNDIDEYNENNYIVSSLKKKSKLKIWVIILIIVVCVVLIGIIFVIINCRKRKKNNRIKEKN